MNRMRCVSDCDRCEMSNVFINFYNWTCAARSDIFATILRVSCTQSAVPNIFRLYHACVCACVCAPLSCMKYALPRSRIACFLFFIRHFIEPINKFWSVSPRAKTRHIKQWQQNVYVPSLSFSLLSSDSVRFDGFFILSYLLHRRAIDLRLKRLNCVSMLMILHWFCVRLTVASWPRFDCLFLYGDESTLRMSRRHLLNVKK